MRRADHVNLPTHLGLGMEIRQAVEITRIQSDADGLTLFDKDGRVAQGRQLVLTVPAPQAKRLLHDVAPDLAATADTAIYAPCWTGMYGFDADMLPSAADPIRNDSGPVGWAIWEDHRPSLSVASRDARLVPRWLSRPLLTGALRIWKRRARMWQRRFFQPTGRRAGLRSAHRATVRRTAGGMPA